MNDTYNHPKELWLSPWCDDCEDAALIGDEGRQWCQENIFEPCVECGRMPDRYLLAFPKNVVKSECHECRKWVDDVGAPRCTRHGLAEG